VDYISISTSVETRW